MSKSSAAPIHRDITVFRSVAEIPAGFGPTVAAIGNFDGVHLGHQQILSAVATDARSLGAKAVAITFEPHPEQFLRPAQAPRLLTPLDERLRLLGFTGIDAVLVLPFDAALATLPALDFVRTILVGHNAEAGIAELMNLAADFAFGLQIHPPVKAHGLEVSSSAIRERIAAGDMTRARWMLGRPFEVRSTQVRDRGIGTRLLVPTINLAPYKELLPAFGVYVTRLTIAGRSFQAVTNVGNRPTFGEASFAVESHILNFEPIDLDAQTPIQLEFLLRLRGEIEWPSPEALKAQIFKDVAKAKRYFQLVG
jgi:riboflavin kinase/FMN adenylyltransferase